MTFTPRNLTSASRFSRPRVHAIPQETHDVRNVDEEGRDLHEDPFNPGHFVPAVHIRVEKLVTPVKPLKGWKAFLYAMFGSTTDEERNRWSAY